MKRFAVALLILIGLGSTALGFVDPFQKLLGPVGRVEYWSYEIKMKFGSPTEEESGHTITLYDTRGNEIETIHYKRSGAVETRYVRAFDERDRLVQVEEYNWLGNLVKKVVATYAGNVQKWRGYDKNGELVVANNSEFDEDGNLIHMVVYDEETGDVSSTGDIAYTQSGEPSLAETRDADGNLMFKSEYTYGIEGKDAIGEAVIYLLGVELITTRSALVLAEKDTYGNWTEKRRYELEEKFGEENFVLTDIYRREIEYY